MDWIAVDGGGEGSARAAYEVALDAYGEPGPDLVCRNAAGRTLKKVPAQVRGSGEAEVLQALADWLADHAAHARAEAERWMTRSLPLPARLLHAVWPDPYWRRVLRHLVIAPHLPDGSADVARAGLLVGAGPGAAHGLRVVAPEGELVLDEPLVTVPHPVLLDPDGRGLLERWRALLGAHGGEQGVEQLHRTVWWRPRAAPTTGRTWRGVDAFDGAEFDSGARFERAVSRFGGRIRGETAHFDVYAGPACHAMRIDLRWQGPMSGTLMNDVHWGPRGTSRQGAGAFDDIPPVAWSEGMRTAAHLYDARDGGYRQEDRPDASTAYQSFLVRCAVNAGPDDRCGHGGTAPGAWEDAELLDAGGIAPGTPADTADDEDALAVCRYDWAGLDEGDRIVRLVPRRGAGTEDAVARVLGLVPVPDGHAGRAVVGRVRSAPLGFLARVCRAEPADAHRAIGLLKQLRTCAATAATKPGRAAKALEKAVVPLEAVSPGLSTAVLEEGARIIAEAGSPAMAQPLFARAREVEKRSGAAVDEDALVESFVRCAAAGAVSKRALADHRDDLAARLPAPEAAHHHRRLVLAWHRAGLASGPEFARVLLDLAGGTAPADAEHRALLRGLLSHGGMDDATMDVWEGWAPVLSALLSEGAVAPGELLTLTAAPAGSGRVALAEAAAGWLRLLRGTGAGALLTGADEAAKSGSPGGDAGAVLAVEDVVSWLDRFARRYRGMRQPVEGLPGLLAGIGARLRAEGVSYRALPALRMPDTRASSRDRCLDLGLLDALLAADVPVRDDETEPLGFVGWLGRAKGDDLPRLTRDARFAPRLAAALSDPPDTLSIGQCRPHPLARGTGPVRTLTTGPALRAFAAGFLRERVRRAAEGGVLPLRTALRDLEPFALPAARRHVADDLERLLAVDPAVALARTLRAGVPDEWGLPVAEWQRGDWFEVRDGGDALLLVGHGRALAAGPEGVRARWADEAYDHRTTWHTGVRWEGGAFVPEPFDGFQRVRSSSRPADRETVLFPGDGRSRTVHRVAGRRSQEYGELRCPDGTVVAAWALTGNGVFGLRRGRWAAGSPFTPPPNWWHLMRPRDEAGSARLRGADTATAEDLLAGVGPETRADVGWLADARSSTRGVHDTTERVWAELGRAVRRTLPEVTDDRLVDGLAGVLWSAVECQETRARLGGG